jgi:hypothetical protein
MIAMWGANSFRTMQKLLGLFSSRYLRGSQNICMAKQLKQIDGHIAQINAPRFAEDRNMWVMTVKENGKWQAVTVIKPQSITNS